MSLAKKRFAGAGVGIREDENGEKKTKATGAGDRENLNQRKERCRRQWRASLVVGVKGEGRALVRGTESSDSVECPCG